MNFGNDPFATVEEGGGIRMKRIGWEGKVVEAVEERVEG